MHNIQKFFLSILCVLLLLGNEPLVINGESQFERKRLEVRSKQQRILDKITRPKVKRVEEVLYRNAEGQEMVTEF